MISPAAVRPIWIRALLLLGAFVLLLAGIQQQSLWLDEARAADAVYDAGRLPEGMRDTLRYLRDSFQQTFERVRSDVHPPFYLLLLDAWTLLVGESELALRLPSALAGLIAVAGVAALARLWFSQRAGWFALILLVTSGFFLQYAQQARMVTLLLALATLMLLAYTHHERRPRRSSAVWLILTSTLALYTHYAALVLLVLLLIYTLIRRRWRLAGLLLLPALLFVPWLPFALDQWRLGAVLPLASDPAMLAVLLLPWSLLIARLLDAVRPPRFSQLVALLLLVSLCVTQLSIREHNKAHWREAVTQAAQNRRAIEPLVMNIPPHSPLNYYDRRYPLTQGYTLDIGWKSHMPAETERLLTLLDPVPAVWVALPMQDPSSWDAVIHLIKTHSAGYRDGVQGTIFYRFDSERGTALQFAFGETLLEWSPQALQVAAGQSLCLQTGLPVMPDHSMLLALTHGYHEVLAQSQVEAAPQACLDLPASLPDAVLHLRLYLLDAAGQRLPLTEHGHYWGDYLMLGTAQP